MNQIAGFRVYFVDAEARIVSATCRDEAVHIARALRPGLLVTKIEPATQLFSSEKRCIKSNPAA